MRLGSSFMICFSIFISGCQERPGALEKYGAALSLRDETKVSVILSEPENFLGKKVLIRGEISDVCAMAGCWLEVAGDRPKEKIKVKVDDGEIVFPVSAKRKNARVEGEVYKIELSAEQARSYLAHLAEEKGATSEDSSVTGPMLIYQIKGLGAEISQ
ncbi:MAG: DUF4920 domain-containing protein [bacterium]